MKNQEKSKIQIALIGGGELCREVLEKTVISSPRKGINAQIKAVADPNPFDPSITLAKDLGLYTTTDYRDLYNHELGINLFILLSPENGLLEEILANKPSHLRVLSYHVFSLFWENLHAEERKLREKTEELETILNGIQDFILVITPDRTILNANKAFLDSMGYEREEVVGKKCHEIFQKTDHPCQQEGIICPLNEAVRNEMPSQQVLTRVDQKGRTKYIEVTIFPIWEDKAKVLKFIEVSRDITDRKKQEERITKRLEEMVKERTKQLEETHAKLLHKDKMASLGKLAASVVHEINNPIAGILNLIMLIHRIIEEESIDEKHLKKFRDYLTLMETETRRISRIVSNLLAFSRQSKFDLKPFDLNKLIEKTLLLNSNLLRLNKITIQKSLDPSLPPLVGSEDQLQQVFMNLISNAVEAMASKKAGTLSIKTQFLPDANQALVTVSDNGIGIPPENLSKLFEPFFTTKKRGKGVGLGLSLAYGIVQEHGGSITVHSEPNHGATFELVLPLRAKPPKQTQEGGLHEWREDSHS